MVCIQKQIYDGLRSTRILNHLKGLEIIHLEIYLYFSFNIQMRNSMIRIEGENDNEKISS